MRRAGPDSLLRGEYSKEGNGREGSLSGPCQSYVLINRICNIHSLGDWVAWVNVIGGRGKIISQVVPIRNQVQEGHSMLFVFNVLHKNISKQNGHCKLLSHFPVIFNVKGN